jgi:anaerobic magnesium-protoporphyrin IX monomethyl ester cyclase
MLRCVSGLRVALIYPPPWKIPDDQTPLDPVDGPPSGFVPSDLDSDFFQVPYGLLSLAAQAWRAGHVVKVLNLSGYPWSTVEELLRQLDADVVGMSCWTANRRGVRMVAELVKALSPTTHVTVGGPHITPLARQFLEHYPAVDSAIVGEGELTFLELLERLALGRPLAGLAGALVRTGSGIGSFVARPTITHLDELESVHRHFPTHIVMTSRGCPWACTFCGAESSWGRGFRPFSVNRVLDDLQAALERTRVRILLVKDDTFTTNRERVFQLCRGIRDRKLNFLWSCDTRVDVLREDLIREMRLAGCERMSLGVESGAPQILKAINKKISVEQILNSTELTRRYGIRARYFMMLGNRGETQKTFEETLEFLKIARPHQYIFSCLSIYPGTKDFADAVAAGWLDPEQYFTGQFQELKVPFDASHEDAALMDAWFAANRGIRDQYVPSVEDLREVVAHLGGAHAASLLDLAEALIERGALAEATEYVDRAEQDDHPLPGLVHNARACIAAEQRDYARVKEELIEGARTDPQHYLLLRNASRAKQWFDSGASSSRTPLRLQARHDFQLFERTEQPALPGPIPEDWRGWTTANRITLIPLNSARVHSAVPATRLGVPR